MFSLAFAIPITLPKTSLSVGAGCPDGFCSFLCALRDAPSGEPAQAEELVDLAQQDEHHQDGGDGLDADVEEGLGLEGIALQAALIVHELRLQLIADADAHEQGAQRHQDALGDHIKEVQPAVTPGGGLHSEQIERGDVVGAQAVQAHQDAQNAGGKSGDDGVSLALVALALVAGLVHKVGHDDLQQGDGGGNCGQDDQQVEDNAEDVTHGTHGVKHVLHGDEQQLGAADGALGIQGETGGHDSQAGHQGNEGIADDDDQSVLFNVLLLIQVGAVGDHDTHAQGQGEEHLTACVGQDRDDTGCLFDNAVLHSPAGNEHVLQAIHSAGQGAGADDDDDQHEEQAGHTDGAELLDTAGHAAHNDDEGQQHEDEAVDHGLQLIGQHVAEHLAAGQAVVAEAGAEDVAHVQNHVLHAVAAQGAIEAQDQERSDDAQPAQPLESLAQDLVRADHAAPGLAAQSQLAHHDHEAAQSRQDQVNDEECESAVSAHLIGEAPDVAKADCRTNGCHQESKCGSKAFSFFHFFLSLV